MAHIFDLAPEISPYKEGRLSGDRVKFPDTPVFQHMNKPSRFEGDVFDLEFAGTIPKDIDGTFYRIQPDHRFPPLFEDDIHFNGDGSVTAIRIQNGQADFKQRYVHNERYKLETAARKSLFGRYRNPFTDNESVKGVIRTASNTNIIFWRGVLLATKEDGPPYAMDPVTLETIGRFDADGQLLAPNFTAHPKFDPDTGEMVCFAYEAGGNGNDCSRDIVVWTFDADGVKTEEAWYTAPFAGMIHDCGLTKNYLVLPLTPLKSSLERLKKGGNKFVWDPNEDQWYGLVPRRGGKSEDIVWFRAENGFHGHVAGCYENEDGHVVVDLTVADGNVFFWFPPEGQEGKPPKRDNLTSPTVRWILDPRAKTNTRIKPTLVWPINGEFSRIDDRFTTKKYKHFWQAVIDPSRPYDFAKCGPPAGGLFNCLGHFAWDLDNEKGTGTEDVYFAGPTKTFQEPTFIPKTDGAEGEGYLIALLNHLDVLRNDVVIFDAQNMAAGPVATIHLPLKLKLGLHGNFVNHRDIEAWQKRRAPGGDLGPVQPATEPLPWQKALLREEQSKTNGAHGAADQSKGDFGWFSSTHKIAPHAGLVHLKEYDIKDSNVQWIGTAIDHKVKYASAASEPAWNDGRVGIEAGVFAWRIEDFAVVPWPVREAGGMFFYDGDSYIVLNSAPARGTRETGHENVPLVHDIFFWLGSRTSQDEAGVAAYKTVELDEFLRGTATQHRELQSSMSDAFRALFPRLTIRAGGVQSGFRHVGEDERAGQGHTKPTLLRVFQPADRSAVVVCEVEPTWRSLDDGDVFILDVGDKIWVWQGSMSRPLEKAKAAQVVHDLKLAKNVDEEVLSQTEPRSQVVVKLLGGDEAQESQYSSPRPVAGLTAARRPRRLFRLSDASGELRFDLIKEGAVMSRRDLHSNDVFLLDNEGRSVWVWEGSGASKAERTLWLKVAHTYLANIEEDPDAYLTPIAKVRDGYESTEFIQTIEVS